MSESALREKVEGLVTYYEHRIGPTWTPANSGSFSPEPLVPMCSESCVAHDGKRCGVMGSRAPRMCEPAVAAMASMLYERAEEP